MSSADLRDEREKFDVRAIARERFVHDLAVGADADGAQLLVVHRDFPCRSIQFDSVEIGRNFVHFFFHEERAGALRRACVYLRPRKRRFLIRP